MVRRFWHSSGGVQGRIGACRGRGGCGRIRGSSAERRRCEQEIARALFVRSSSTASSGSAILVLWAAQQQLFVNQLSLTGALHADDIRSARPALHCSPAAQPIVAVFRQTGQLASFDPSWCARPSQASAYLTSSTSRSPLHHHTFRPPPHHLPAHAIAAATRAPAAIAASARLLPLPARLSAARAAALPARPPGFACLAAFARAPAATTLPHHPVAPE